MKMTVADYIVDHIAQYIDKIFVVYGSACGTLVDSVARHDKIDYVCTFTEQAGVFAAEGYQKAGKAFGAAIVTSGPGSQAAIIGLANSYFDSFPLLLLTGQVHSKFMRQSKEVRQVGFQENDIVDMVKPVTKHAVMIREAKSVRYEIEKAIHIMLEGRPGSVLVDLPLNVAKEVVETDDLIGYRQVQVESSPSEVDDQINQLIHDIKNAKRPVFLVGGGLNSCREYNKESLNDLMNKLKLPFITTWNAFDLVDNNSDYYAGAVGTYGGRGRNFAIQNADLIISLTSRISGRITGGRLETWGRAAKKWMINIDEAEMQPYLQQIPFDEFIHCNITYFLYRIHKILSTADYDSLPYEGWTKKCKDWRDKYDPVLPEFYQQTKPLHPYVFCRELCKHLKQDDIVTVDCGGNVVTWQHSAIIPNGVRYYSNHGNSPMGFSFAAGIGSCLAYPKGQVVAIIGDGGFNMNLQDLQTLNTYNLPLKTFIMNNRCYGITVGYQRINFGGRTEACTPATGYNPPNFIKIVQAYGIKTFEIPFDATIEQMNATIAEVLAYPQACVCDFRCDSFTDYLPKIGNWEAPIEDQEPYLPKEEFLSNMIIEPDPFSLKIRGGQG